MPHVLPVLFASLGWRKLYRKSVKVGPPFWQRQLSQCGWDAKPALGLLLRHLLLSARMRQHLAVLASAA